MNTPEKRRLLRKWEKQRLALQSKIQQVLENRDSEEVAIKRFTIDWENAGLNLYSTENLGGKTNEQRRLVKEAARKCQPGNFRTRHAGRPRDQAPRLQRARQG